MDRVRLFNWMPGLKNLLNYETAWLRPDIKSGLSVAAVALPVSIAYSELAGVGAIVGLYSCILPMIAYALFGSSRQLIVGPDAATCAVMAAVVAPIAMGNSELHWQLIVIMTMMMGLWCLVASRFKLGALSDLLSQPILTGLLNGLAITIVVGQIPKVFGFQPDISGLIERLIVFPHRVWSEGDWLTIAISALTLLVLLLVKRFRSGWPAPLIAMVIATFTTWCSGIYEQGVATIDGFSSALPMVQWHSFQPGLMRDMVIPALNLTLISFVSMMLTARSFATKNGYEVNADTELRALGIINIVSALSQGFAISGASSRTAINDSNGGKSQMVSVIAGLTIGIIVLFFTAPLRFVPVPALGIVLIYASWGLLDLRGIWQLRKRNLEAFRLALFTLASVLVVGIIPGIGLAVLLGLIQFFRVVFRPTDRLLGLDEDGMIRSLGNESTVKGVPGVLIYRFNAPLTYFNAAYFKRRILNLVDGTPLEPRWVVIDAVASFTHADISVLAAVNDLKRELSLRHIKLVLAGRRTELTRWFNENRTISNDNDLLLISDLYLALKYIQSKECAEE